MENLWEICEQQGVPIEKLLEFALKNLEESKAQIYVLQQEKKILTEKLNMQNDLCAAGNQRLEQRLALNERSFKEAELARAYEVARLSLCKSTEHRDAVLLKLRLEDALDDLEELQMRFDVLTLQLKEEKAKAEALNQRFLEREKDASDQQSSQRILELEQRAQNLHESLVRMEKDHRNELTKANTECKRISSIRKQEVTALLRERNFVWNQLKRMEEDYANRLRSKEQQLQLAHESIEKLHLTIEELQHANDEKNVELTVLKIEMGECEREIQMSKDDDLKHLKCNKPPQELRSAVYIGKENKDNEIRVLSMNDSGGRETEENFLEQNLGWTETGNQDIGIRPGTPTEKNDLVSEEKLQATELANEKQKHKRILEMLEFVQPNNNNQFRDKEEPARNNAASNEEICHNLDAEHEDVAMHSDPARQSDVNELPIDSCVVGKSMQKRQKTDTDDLQDKVNLLQDIPAKHEKRVLDGDANSCNCQTSSMTKNINSNKRQRHAKSLDFQRDDALKNSNLDKANITTSVNLHKRQLRVDDLDFQVKDPPSSAPTQSCNCRSSKMKSLRVTGNRSQENAGSQQRFSHAIKFEENLRPVRASLFPSSFSVPKVKVTPS